MYTTNEHEGFSQDNFGTVGMSMLFLILDGFLNRMTGRVLCGATFFTHIEGDPLHVEFGKGQVSYIIKNGFQNSV